MSKITVDSLAKHYGDVVGVDGISFEVKDGEIVSLLGPSGCGKSTTLRCIAGLERLTDGSVSINGEPLSASERDVHVPPAERNLGMVFQSFALWPNKTVLGNVKFGLKYSPSVNMSDDEMTERAMEYLDLVDLDGYEDSHPRELSGGEQQRVALARALVYNPDVLLLDEPLSNLDAKLRKEARIWLKELQDETDITTLYVTHDQTEASALSDRMIILNEGRIEQTGTPEEVFERPDNRFVADFLGKENFLTGKYNPRPDDAASVRTSIGGELELHERRQNGLNAGDRVAIAISSEEVEILDDGSSATNNTFEGVIDQKLYYGDKTELVIHFGDEEIVAVVDRTDKDEGDAVTVRFPPDHCAVLRE